MCFPDLNENMRLILDFSMYKFYHLTHYTHAICFVVGYSRNDYSYCLFKLVDDLICFDP